MSSPAVCPCGISDLPATPYNPPGRSVINYRSADFVSLRHALLHSLDGEVQLARNWRPGGDGDLGVQMIEWWAYLGDILSLYNERIAHQTYLRTADQPSNLRALIELLGYRPRPGMGARGVVAPLVNGGATFTLPRGFKIQSKPGPGKPPQIFEVDADTAIATPDAVPFDPPPFPTDLTMSDRVLLRGAVTSVRRGTQILIVPKGWSAKPTDSQWNLRTVVDSWPEKDPRSGINTRVVFDSLLDLTPKPPSYTVDPADYRILWGGQAVYLWHYNGTDPVKTATVASRTVVELQSVVRQIRVGDLVLLYLRSSGAAALVFVTGYSELVWFANAAASSPSTPPASIPIPVLHTELEVSGSVTPKDWNDNQAQAAVLYAWREAGQLIPDPARTLGADDFKDGKLPIKAIRPASFPPSGAAGLRLLIEDAGATGVQTIGTAQTPDTSELSLDQPTTMDDPLTPPLRALLNLVPVSRGETVNGEVLGSGDATQTGQEFVLKKSPLTYLADPASASGKPYRSTLRVWVDGIEWHEVASFYGQPPSTTIFTTREDSSELTHVVFGDGVNGARLPTGRSNIVGTYRIGSGAPVPSAGSLSVIVKPYPKLKAIRSPVVVWGGADPDPPEHIREYAPRSVLAFGRAVSAQDYEAIAAQAPGVARARAYWSWDVNQQRNTVKLYVGDGAGAVTAATEALLGSGDSNRPLTVLPAVPIYERSLAIAVAMTPDFRLEDVQAAARAAFFDARTGFFSRPNMGVGRSIFKSELVTCCLRVPGVAAVHAINFSTQSPPVGGVRWDPGEGGYFVLGPDDFSLGIAGT